MFDSRKFRVGLISIGAVLAIYLLYSMLTKTPRIEIRSGQEVIDTVTDGDADVIGDKVGMIGNVGVGGVRKAEYIHLNEQKQVDRVVGFEELLHKTENEWEVNKPYMNIYRPDLGCYITSDKGEFRVETVAGRPSPKDARFTGNVVAHILPENSSDVKEGFLYLDDVTFISDKSQFFTLGPVKYISQDTQMLGSGLELVYNERLERIEYLRVFQLESLLLKTAESSLFPTDNTEALKPADANSRMLTQQPEKTFTLDDSQRVKSLSDTNTKSEEPNEPERYRCVFSENVVIDTPEQLIFAGEKISITDIFRPGASGEKPDKADPCGTDYVKKTADDSAAEAQKDLEPNSAGSPSSPVMPEPEPIDIVVTCDKGLVVTPMGFPETDTNSVHVSSEQLLETAEDRLKQLKKNDGRAVFIGQKIGYSAFTGDTVATGPSELTFYTGDLIRPDANKALVPVKIAARRKAQFLPATNQAVFEGDCRCQMLREDANSRQQYTLSAPQLTVDLSRDKDKQSSASAATIEYLTASGQTVRLQSIKTAQERLLGGFEMKCVKFEYDASRQSFLAVGPGIVKVDNSNISEPNEEAGRFSLRRRCFAVVENFDTLKFLLETNQIIAEAEGRGVIVDYFPVVDGKPGQHVTVTAGRVVTNLLETADGRTEISTLYATGGVTYEEGDMEFAGSRLFYDADESIVTVQGDQSHPCIYNGTLVDQIEYDLKTGDVKFQIVGPGVIQGKR